MIRFFGYFEGEIRFSLSQEVGRVVGGTKYRGHTIKVTVGNDIVGTDWKGTNKIFKTLITESEVNGEKLNAGHVIKTEFFESRITRRRIREAVESWKEMLDILLEDNK